MGFWKNLSSIMSQSVCPECKQIVCGLEDDYNYIDGKKVHQLCFLLYHNKKTRVLAGL